MLPNLTRGLQFAGCVACLVASQAASAASLAFQLGFDAGGDTLATAFYTDGDDADIKAGQLFHLAAGVVQPVSEQMEFQGTLGWKFDSAAADNGDISFDRFPLEGLLFFRNDRFRLGGGAALHLNPTLEGSGAASGLGTIEFDDALGFVAQIDMFIAPQVNIGLRATFIEYETTVGSVTVDGNSVGLVFTGRID